MKPHHSKKLNEVFKILSDQVFKKIKKYKNYDLLIFLWFYIEFPNILCWFAV